MRWHRNAMNHLDQPSTSYASSHDSRFMGRRQNAYNQDRVPPPPPDFAANDDLFFDRSQDNVGTLDQPRLYAGGVAHPSNQQQKGASTASVIVFAFALSGILLVFLLFYFLAKVCSPASEEDLKERASDSMAGISIRRPITTRKLASGVQESPRHVLYPRRIYELQAEEGCYSSLPSMKTPEVQDDVVSFKKSTPSSKRRNFKQLVRKLTTHSMPANSAENYSPSDSPRFSTCSET